jgi:hypothetical protein
MADYNTWSDVSSIAQRVEADAHFIVREFGVMPGLVTVFRDATGMNLRRGYKYNAGTVVVVGDEDDLTSKSFKPSADQTLTPAENGLMFQITDARAESDLPENILADGAKELGFAALDKVESDLAGDMASLTGGTVGTAGSTITWGHIAAAISQARNANKSMVKPLACVMHGYQWAVLAKGASVAGASLAQAPGFTEEITRRGMVAEFMGVPLYQSFQTPDSADDFTGGVFPREAIAIDWRRYIRIRGERNESARAIELVMSQIYAHGVWRPELGVQFIFDALKPSS